MIIKKMRWVSSLLCIIPALSFADITIMNNTDYYGTAYTNLIPCSSQFGFVMPPHQPATISQSTIDLICPFGCDVHVFLSKNCSGNEFATVHVDPGYGITRVDNHDTQHFEIVGSGTSVTVNQIKGWKKWLTLFN